MHVFADLVNLARLVRTPRAKVLFDTLTKQLDTRHPFRDYGRDSLVRLGFRPPGIMLAVDLPPIIRGGNTLLMHLPQIREGGPQGLYPPAQNLGIFEVDIQQVYLCFD
jgi:hypothetical protein